MVLLSLVLLFVLVAFVLLLSLLLSIVSLLLLLVVVVVVVALLLLVYVYMYVTCCFGLGCLLLFVGIVYHLYCLNYVYRVSKSNLARSRAGLEKARLEKT